MESKKEVAIGYMPLNMYRKSINLCQQAAGVDRCMDCRHVSINQTAPLTCTLHQIPTASVFVCQDFEHPKKLDF